MANANSTAPQNYEGAQEHAVRVPHPIIKGWTVRLPPKGKLKWLGGNLGMTCPVGEDVIDDSGRWLVLNLEELLTRLDELDGYRGNRTVKEDRLDACFDAYQYNFLTTSEKASFEAYVRREIGKSTPVDAARAILAQQNN